MVFTSLVGWDRRRRESNPDAMLISLCPYFMIEAAISEVGNSILEAGHHVLNGRV